MKPNYFMTAFDLPRLQETLFSVKRWQKNEWPEISGIRYIEESNEQQSTVEIQCFIPQSLAWFTGHYPSQPVLPGVVQTYWASELSQILFQTNQFRGINALKFINMVMPETPLKLILNFNKETNSVSFSYVKDSDSEIIKCSTGKVVFAH